MGVLYRPFPGHLPPIQASSQVPPYRAHPPPRPPYSPYLLGNGGEFIAPDIPTTGDSTNLTY